MYAVDGHVVVKARGGYRKYYLARVRKMGGGQQVLWREWETALEAEAYGRRWVRRWEELHTPPPAHQGKGAASNVVDDGTSRSAAPLREDDEEEGR